MFLYIWISFILGLLFWSLSTVLTERWHSGKGGILFWRSECPKCHKTLTAWELVPLFSYIFQRGKCRKCHSHISYIYPASELIIWLIFAILSYKAWMIGFDIFSWEHILLLALGFITWVYMLYDIRYMEIPDQIMIPGIWTIIVIMTLAAFSPSVGNLFFDITTYNWWINNYIIDHIRGAWVLYSFLYIQILLPGWWYLLRWKEIREFVDLMLSYFLFPLYLLFSPLMRKWEVSEEKSIPTWVGGWDLRIALFIGLSLGTLHGIFAFAIAYMIGSIFGIGLLILRASRYHKISHQIPFGPFLGIWWILAVLFHEEIFDWFEIIRIIYL